MTADCFSIILWFLIAAYPSILQSHSKVISSGVEIDSNHQYYNRKSQTKIIDLAFFFPITGLDVGTATVSFKMRHVFSQNHKLKSHHETTLEIGVPCSLSEGLTLTETKICADAACQSYESKGDQNCAGKAESERLRRTIRLPFKDLLKMAQARTNSIEFGAGTYTLTRAQRLKLRNFVRQIQTP